MSEAPSEVQIIQDAANLGLLARQAISNQFATMEVDPKICANVALLVERLRKTTEATPVGNETLEDSVLEDARKSLEQAKEEGRREMIGEFAQEKADLLQQLSDLQEAFDDLVFRAQKADDERILGQVTLVSELPVSNASSEADSAFKGPGQN